MSLNIILYLRNLATSLHTILFILLINFRHSKSVDFFLPFYFNVSLLWIFSSLLQKIYCLQKKMFFGKGVAGYGFNESFISIFLPIYFYRDSGSYYILAQNRFGSCREEFSVHVSTPRIFQEPVPQPSQVIIMDLIG